MVLTTLLLRLFKTSERTKREILPFNSVLLGLIVFSFPLLTGCGSGGDSGLDQAIANPGNGNGNGYGLNNNGPAISLSPTAIAFSATQGGSNPAARTVSIANSGTGTLNWSVSTTSGWLLLSPTSGSAPDSFTVTPIIAGLAAGTYSTTVTVAGTGTGNSPQSIPIDLTISTSTSTGSTPPSSTSTAAVTLAWDPVRDSSVTGYYVHFGLQSPHSAGSCAYTQSAFYALSSLPNTSTPTATVSGLASNTTYYFAVSAYNGLQSPCSTEVSTVTKSA